MVTRWPARTSRGYFWPPKRRTVLAGVEAAPIRTSGPTTMLWRSVKAAGKPASERVEQFSTTPCGRS